MKLKDFVEYIFGKPLTKQQRLVAHMLEQTNREPVKAVWMPYDKSKPISKISQGLEPVFDPYYERKYGSIANRFFTSNKDYLKGVVKNSPPETSAPTGRFSLAGINKSSDPKGLSGLSANMIIIDDPIAEDVFVVEKPEYFIMKERK